MSLLDENRNVIINGSFFRDNRNASRFAPFAYAAGFDNYAVDKWHLRSDETNTTGSSFSIQQFALGQTDVKGNPRNYFRLNHTSVSANGSILRLTQRIESVRTLSGGRVGLSLYMKASSAITVGFALRQHFGTSGSPSSDVTLTTQSLTLTTSWKIYDLQFDLTSISSKTLGTDLNDYLELRILPPLNTTFTLDIAQVCLAKKTKAYELAGANHLEEEGLMRRYYRKNYLESELAGATFTAANDFAHGGTMDGSNGFTSLEFDREMRATPTVGTWSGAGTGGTGSSRRCDTNTGSNVAFTSFGITRRGFKAYLTGSFSYCIFRYTADADFYN